MNTIRESCACGATVVITFNAGWEARSEAESWRKKHRHEPAQPDPPLDKHICDDECRHDKTVHDTAFGPVQLITDCRVPNNAFYGIHEAFGAHTCTDEKPCDTRQGWRLRS